MERQARTGYGVAALLFVSGCLLFAAGAVGIVPTPKRPLTIGTNLWIGYEPFHLARAAGVLPGDVTLVEARSSPSLMEAVDAGSLDGAALTMDEVMQLEAAGRPMAILAVLDVSRGADVVLARTAEIAESSPAGRRIGVEMEGVGGFMLHRFLEHRGLTRDRVQVVPVPAGDHDDAMQRLNLDYIISYEPLVSRLVEAGAVRVFDSAALPGEIVDVLAIRRDRLVGRETAVRHLMLAWYQGVHLLIRGDDNGSAMARVINRQGLDEAQIRQILSRLDFPDPDGSRSILIPGSVAMQQAGRWLVASGAVSSAPVPVIDTRFLPE